jgi:CubicO group peptidase (beta-lactamase class C family)
MASSRSALLLVLVMLGSASALPAEPADPAPDTASHPRVKQALHVARTWLEAQRAYDQIPGISAAIVHDQDVLWSGGFGKADLASGRPATADTLYSVCSISKVFTSLAVLQQRDAGKLRLDDPVGRHLPWFALRKTEGEGDVTIEGLLTHASGLPRESDHAYWTGPDFPFPTRDEIRGRLSAQDALYAPETAFQYSNLGMSLAGEVVAATSGTPYADYARKNLLEPLGMKSTFPEMPEPERGKRLAQGYSALGRDGRRQPTPFFLTRGIAAAAGYASNAEDLARFASWQFRLLAKGGSEVLKATTLREMHRIHWVEPDFETTWGLGFAVWRGDGKVFVGHGGSCPGFRTHLLMMPEEKLATVFLANAQGVNTNQWSQKLYDLVAPAIKAATREPAAAAKAKPEDPALQKYEGTYSSGFAGETAIFAWEDGLGMLFLPTMEPVKGIVKLKKTGENVFRRVRKDEKLGEELVFELGPDGRASRFRFHSNYQKRVQ